MKTCTLSGAILSGVANAVVWVPVTLSVAACVAAGQVPGQVAPKAPEVIVKQNAAGMEATIGAETLGVVVCSDGVVRVVTRPEGGNAEHPQPWLLPVKQSCPGAKFEFSQTAKNAVLKTARLTVTLSLEHGNLSYATSEGKTFSARGWGGA